MKINLTVKDVCVIAMLIALVVVGTFIKVDVGHSAMVHLGTAVIFTTSLVFGPLYGLMAGALGSAVFDLFSGLGVFTPWSLVIKGLAGLVVGLIAKKGWGRHAVNDWTRDIFGSIAGMLVNMGGYMIAWRVVLGSWEIAVVNLPSTIITSGIGIVVALAVSRPLRRALEKAQLF